MTATRVVLKPRFAEAIPDLTPVAKLSQGASYDKIRKLSGMERLQGPWLVGTCLLRCDPNVSETS
jgi:hypothetical protein